MDRLFAACSKLVQTLRKKFSCFDIDPNSIEGEACGIVDPDLLDEIWLPSYVCSQKLVQFWRIVEKLVGCEVLSETAVAIWTQIFCFEGKR